MSQTQQSNTYSASEITVLEGLEAVRKRPGMYIGNTNKAGLHRCLGEILDNSVDECMAQYADTIKVVIHNSDHWAMVADNGRGIPTDVHPKTQKSALETILTVLHAGGKFDQNNYQFAGGLHGVGASVVNALSSHLDVWVLRDKTVFYMAFSEGKSTTQLQSMTIDQFTAQFPDIAIHTVWTQSGTVIRFYPDESIFETVVFTISDIIHYLRQTAYLNKGLTLIFEDAASTNEALSITDQDLNSLSQTSIEDFLSLIA